MKSDELLSKYNTILAILQAAYMEGNKSAEEMKALQLQFAETYHEIQEKLNAADGKKDTTTAVTLDIFRYEELLDLEARVDTLAAFARHHETVSEEDMFLILGYTDDAKLVKERGMERLKKWAKASKMDAKAVITK